MNKKTEEFVSLLTVENGKAVGQYIIDIFGNQGQEPNPVKVLDYDFNMSYGVMQPGKEANTSFSFDFPSDHAFIKKIIDLIGDEETENTKEVVEQFNTFLKSIKNHLEENIEILKEKVTIGVLGKGPTIKELKIRDIVITDLPDIDWVISVKKLVNPNIPPGPPVSQDLINEYLRTGEELNDIIKRRKEEGDTRYETVQSAERRKSFYECDVIMWADYSIR